MPVDGGKLIDTSGMILVRGRPPAARGPQPDDDAWLPDLLAVLPSSPCRALLGAGCQPCGVGEEQHCCRSDLGSGDSSNLWIIAGRRQS